MSKIERVLNEIVEFTDDELARLDTESLMSLVEALEPEEGAQTLARLRARLTAASWHAWNN